VEADALEMHKMAFSFVCAMNALPLWWVFFLFEEKEDGFLWPSGVLRCVC